MTKKELPILGMGLVAAALLFQMHPAVVLRYILFLYAWGLVFETVTHNLWRYAPDLGKTRFSIPGLDINLLFPSGWMFLAAVSDFFSASWWEFLLWTGSMGTVMEILFFRLNYWTYDYDGRFLRLFRPFRPLITVFGVPVQVIAAYFLVIGSANWYLMERILP